MKYSISSFDTLSLGGGFIYKVFEVICNNNETFLICINNEIVARMLHKDYERILDTTEVPMECYDRNNIPLGKYYDVLQECCKIYDNTTK